MVVFAKTYRDLIVFQKAYAAALEIHKLTQVWPKTEQFGGMADQIRRSSKGICANVAEGFGKKSEGAEFRRFMGIALGSANETRVWLDFALDLGFGERALLQKLVEDYDEIVRILGRLKSPAK